jgi:peptide/nickel transport system substrate-binding protein
MLQYAFPYDDLASGFYQGLCDPAAGPLHPNFLNDPTLPLFEQDLDKAKSLLEEAGYGPGELTLTFVWDTGGVEKKPPGLLLQDALAQIGVTLEMEEIPFASIMERTASGAENTADIMTLIQSPTNADPGVGLLESIFHSVNAGGPWNWGHYKNPEFDTLIDAAQKTVDEEERLDMYREAQKLLIEDAAALFLCHPDRWVVMNKDVGGFWFDPIGTEWQPWYDMYWLE